MGLTWKIHRTVSTLKLITIVTVIILVILRSVLLQKQGKRQIPFAKTLETLVQRIDYYYFKQESMSSA